MLVLAGTFAYLGVTFLKNRALLSELWKLLDAAKHFKFGSNKLDDLGNYLGVGESCSPWAGIRCWALWREIDVVGPT